jgi:hypothetical protein
MIAQRQLLPGEVARLDPLERRASARTMHTENLAD